MLPDRVAVSQESRQTINIGLIFNFNPNNPGFSLGYLRNFDLIFKQRTFDAGRHPVGSSMHRLFDIDLHQQMDTALKIQT